MNVSEPFTYLISTTLVMRLVLPPVSTTMAYRLDASNSDSLTGRYPSRTSDYHIKTGTPTIASFLRDQGYATCMVGKWHNGFDKVDGWNGQFKDGPYGCGFEYFFGIPHSLDKQSCGNSAVQSRAGIKSGDERTIFEYTENSR